MKCFKGHFAKVSSREIEPTNVLCFFSRYPWERQPFHQTLPKSKPNIMSGLQDRHIRFGKDSSTAPAIAVYLL